MRRLLKRLLWEDSTAVHIQSLQLHLPCVSETGVFRPLSSLSFLNGETETEPRTCILHPCSVSAARLDGKSLLLLLNRVRQRRMEEEIFAGTSLLAFSSLLTFAGELIAHGHYLPDLEPGPDGAWCAVWKPCLDGADVRTFRERIVRIPPSAVGEGLRREEVATRVLNVLTDSLVRASVVTTLSLAQADHGRFYSLHDAWFAALRGINPVVRWANKGEIAHLRDVLARWRYPVTCQQRSDTALRFVLSAPSTEEAPWTLRVQISSPSGVRDFPSHISSETTDGLLLSLGQAAILFPPLAAAGEISYEGKRAFGCSLTRDEAHLFLLSSAGLLSGAGYQTVLPEGWQTFHSNAVELAADVRTAEVPEGDPSAVQDAHDPDERVELRWSVTINGERVSADELAQLLQAGSPLVFFRGKWIQVDVRKLQDAFRVRSRDKPENVRARDVVGIVLGNRDKANLRVSYVRADGWLRPFLQQLSGEQPFRVLPQPAELCGELRPYQLRGYSWLCFLRRWGFGACLADDMGLGKTVQTLSFLLHEKTMGEKRPALIVGPTSVLGNWVRETQRFAPSLRFLLHHGVDRRHGDMFPRKAKSVDIVFTSYTLLYRDYSDLRKVEWSGIILDEAQNIKNPDTHQSGAARALSAVYRIALTGTPMENNVGDIWSIMDFLNPGLLGKRSVFRDRYFRPIQTGTDPGARLQLRRMTAPFILRRLKTDKRIISDLPEKVENKVYCPLTVEQAQLYRQTLNLFRRDADTATGISRRGLILGVLTHLKQICNHPANYLGESSAASSRSGKLTRLDEMLEEAFDAGESALIFTQYAEMGTLLQRHLCRRFGTDMPFLHGAVPRKARDRMVESFQNATHPLAFVLSLKAGGTGLNLTRATHVFHYDRWWNPAVENQATDRVFRIGQTHNVMAHKFICGGTLEDRIDRLIEGKTALADSVIINGERGLTELSNTALHDLLDLDTGMDYLTETE